MTATQLELSKEQQDSGDDYNYATFNYDFYNFDLFSEASPGIGDLARDFEVRTIDGRRVHLSDFSGKTIVLENGSITCPMYIRNIDPMMDLRKKYPNVEFLVLYVREAHPGGKIGEHQSFEDKMERAKRVIDEEEEQRTILIDDLQGTAHKLYGSLPNFIFIIDKEFRIRYRADWALPKKVKQVLDQLENNREQLELPVPSLKPPSLGVFYRVFKRAGWKSAIDFFVKSNIRIPLTFIKLKRKWRRQKKAGIYS